jgi:diguanylate cyclase (GGDEF)-like protein
MLMIDVDAFKRLNDHYGHLAGDAVLRHVADVVRGHARLGDTVARYGGDEFAVVLFGVGSAEAVNVAERMRATVASPQMTGDPDVLNVTLSVGVASRWPWGVSARKLVEAADQALLEAKRRGKDRTVSSALRSSVTPPTSTSV